MTKFLNNADIKGYIAQTAVTSYLLKADSTGRLVAAIAGTDYQAPTTALLPSGGTAGQILAKIDGTNYNTQWIDNYTPQVKHDVKLGAALSKGTPVYVSSANGTNMIVSAASNASEATSSKTLGLLETGGVLNDTVKVITEGLLAGLNTSTATAGDPVWLGPNGTLLFGLANKPSAPVHMVSIGIVTRVQSVNGEIFVKVQNGFELDELHNVALASSANNEGLFYDSATSLWKNKTIAAVLGYTPANGANYLPLTGGTLTGDLTLSGTNPRLYFTDTDNNPDYFISNTDGTFTVYDVTNSVGRFKIYSGGNAEFTGSVTTNSTFNITNGLTLFGNHISTQWYNGADGVFVNYVGYNGGTTQFRNFYVYDGKQGAIATFDGATKSTTFSGSVVLNSNSVFQFNAGGYGWLGYPFETGGMSIALSSATRGGGPYQMSFNSNGGFNFANAANSSIWLGLNSSGQLRLNTYTSATSFSGTAAGYLAFDSSGNVITVAGVAATDDTKLPLAGGQMTGQFKSSSTAPIQFNGNSNTGTYNNTTIYSNQNNTSGDTANGIFIERGRLTDSASAEIRQFVIGARGGSIQWRLDGSGNSVQTGNATAAIVYANTHLVTPLIYSGGGSVTLGNNVLVPAGDRGFEVNASGGISLYSNEINAGALGGTGTIYLGWRRTTQVNVGVPMVLSSSISATSGSFSGSITLTGSLVNNTDGAVLMESNASENNNWLWKENAKSWGLFWFNRGSQSGQTIGSYTTIGAELMFMGGGSGIAMPTGWTGYQSGSNIAAMISNYTGYIYSASTIYAASEMRTSVFRFNNSSNNAYLTGNSDWGFRVVNDSGYIQFGPANPSWAHIYSGLPFYFNQNLFVNGTQVVTNSGTWGINVTGNANNITQYTINQSVGTGNSPTFVNVYATSDVRGNDVYTTGGWFRNHSNTNGIYWSTTGWHLMPYNSSDFRIHSGDTGAVSLRLETNGTTRGYVYANSGNEIGFLNNGRSWVLKVSAGGDVIMDYNYGNSIVGVYSSTRFQGVYSMGNAYKLAIDGTSPGNLYGISWGHPNAGGQAGYLNDHGMMIMVNGVTYAAISSNIWARGNITANGYVYANASMRMGDMWEGGGLYRSSGNLVFGTEGAGYKFMVSGTQRAYIGTDGNIWMQWAGDYISTLLGQKAVHRGEGTNYVDYSRYVYNNGAYSGSGWIEPSDLGVRYANSAGSASNSDRLYPFGAAIDNTHPGYGLRAWYDWAYSGTYRNGLTLGSHPSDQSYGWQIWQNMWNDRTYTRRYNGGWQSTRTLMTVEDDPYAYNMNQYVRTSDGPTFQTTYINDWVRTRYESGIYFESYSAGLRSAYQASFGQVATYGTARSSYGGYVIVNNYVTNLMQNTSGDFGFFSNDDWAWRLFYNRGNNCWGIGTDNTYSGDGFRCIKYGSAEYGWTTWSDRRAKENISTINGALDKVLGMRGVYYNYIKDETKSQHVGFIAQELMEILPQSVRYAEEIDEYNINYGPIVSVLSEAIKEQNIEIQSLKAQLQTLLN